MWKVRSICLKNFMAYEDEKIEFKQNQATIIQGENLTDVGFENNGSGKSAILEGLVVGITNSTLRKDTTPKDLIRRGEVECNLVVEMYNLVTKKDLIVERSFFRNTKPSTLRVELTGIDTGNIISVRDGDQFILSQLGISKDDLLNYYLISSERFQSFFSVSDRAKKDLIGRFSNSNIVDSVIEEIKSGRIKLEGSQTKVENQVLGCISTIETLEELIQSKEDEKKPETKGEFKTRVEQKITETNILSDSIRRDTLSIEGSLVDKRLELTDTIAEIKAKDVKVERYAEKIREINFEVRMYTKNIHETEKIKTKLDLKSISSVKCPECSTTFNPNSSEKVDLPTIERHITVAVNYIDECTTSKQKLTKKISTIEEKVTPVESEIAVLKGTKRSRERQIEALEGSVTSNATRITTNDNLVRQLRESISSFQIVDIVEVISEYRSSILQQTKKKREYEEEVKEMSSRIEKAKFWELSFTRFKTHLSNKVIKVIECFINEYLVRMKTDVRIQIDGYKVNKDNSVKENISIVLHRQDGSDDKFSTYSNGERARVEIAAIFAIQKLINTSIQEKSEVGGLEFSFLDEIIDSVDSLGMFNTMKTLQTLEKTISVISHVAFKEHSEDVFNTVTVQKINRISMIKR